MAPCLWTSSTLPVQCPNTLATDALSRACTSVEVGPTLVSDLLPVWAARVYGAEGRSKLADRGGDVGNRVSTQQYLCQAATRLSFWSTPPP